MSAFISLLLLTLLLPGVVKAANQLQIPDTFSEQGSTIQDWQKLSTTTIKNETNFNYYEVDKNKNKTDIYVFDTYTFSLDQMSTIDFSVSVDKGQGSFRPLKINLFFGDEIELDSLAGLADTSGFTGEIDNNNSYTPEGDVSEHVEYLLDQLSMSNGTSSFSGNLDSGDYYLTLSGKAKSYDSNYSISALNVSPVPEPSTYMLILVGLALIGFMAKRQHKKL